jgi:hypothetical protein
MTNEACRSFSQIAGTVRAACRGESALLNGTTITVVCAPLTNLALEMGGFEQAGQMKALVMGVTIPSIHEHLIIGGKTWVVDEVITNLAHVETALLLKAVPAA